jgi:hypothetical protein
MPNPRPPRHPLLLALGLALLLAQFQVCAQPGDAAATPTATGPWQEILDASRLQLRVQGYYLEQGPVAGPTQRSLRLELRPDLWLRYGNATLTLRPRAEAYHDLEGDGEGSGERSYLNEGGLLLGLDESLFVGLGRENLQWGPSQMLSPSNPFIQNNGRANARLEVPGLDYARAVWVPDLAWSLSLIANTGEGAANFQQPFEPSYAAKLDYTGERYYLSLIASRREQQDPVAGFYAGATWSEGLLLYTEGEWDDQGPSVLLGGAYTFEGGSNLILEYYRNAQGCTREPIAACLSSPDPIDPDRALWREHYLLAQVLETGLWGDQLDLWVRWQLGLDDHSSRLSASLTYRLDDHAEAFVWINRNLGGEGDEFGAHNQYTTMLGINLFF